MHEKLAAKMGKGKKTQKTVRKEEETNMKNAPTRMKSHKQQRLHGDIVFCELHLIKRKE